MSSGGKPAHIASPLQIMTEGSRWRRCVQQRIWPPQSGRLFPRVRARSGRCAARLPRPIMIAGGLGVIDAHLKLFGVMLGAFITAVIQSSSATTVMVVGFVNAGIMNLSQAMGVIMGANIGTTVTGWLVSSVEWAKFLSPARPRADCDYYRCDHHADGQETFVKRYFQHYRRVRYPFRRNYNDVVGGLRRSWNQKHSAAFS